ncbi:hypothetical protein C2857_000462 [Epichloe festucae Fl1]|uniref:Uncharacterized protein n=1 Tax=Epichloe festucae (strain Fl1) TaxID=877507 RepID=A0A7U3SNE5_EPIFF|nr:hypothetical protein C2857_000462 [Epichloe festucae Fl1]
MALQDLLPYLEDEIQDADQETFLLYSSPLPSQNLGFIDPKAQSVEVVLAGRDVTIYQMLWKVSPPFAEWLSSPGNPLFRAMLTPSSAVLELGCGISPLNALAAAPRVAHYVLSDQSYVRKLVSRNLVENQSQPCARQRTGTGTGTGSIAFRALDWEQDEVTPGLAAPARWFDAVIATDCVYNYALVDPFVRTCVDACLLSVRERRVGDGACAGDGACVCVCVIAQQLRDHDVFRAWLGRPFPNSRVRFIHTLRYAWILLNGINWTDSSAMPDRLTILGRSPITYSSAVRKNSNILNELDYVPAIKKQYTDLWAQRESIEALVRHHLRLKNEDACTVLDPRVWIQGAFNVCVLVEVASGGSTTKLIFRCPKPHRLVGIMDEKLSSEVGAIRTPYMLLEHIGSDKVQMLSKTLAKHRADPERRQNLFRGLTRIMLSLARIPQARIGSFQFHNDGTVALTNRYLSCSLAILENDGAPRSIQRDHLHSCTDSFVSDLLTFHDGRFLTQPNAAFSENDCRGQMAVKSLLRAISHRYIKREHRNGPYLLKLTDVNPSNIFVDHDWNVQGLIDLEWICATPAEMLEVPYWLTGCSIDEILGKEYVTYDQVRQEFMSILEKEEREMTMEHGISVSRTMGEMWDSKGVWFWYCFNISGCHELPP